MSEVQIVVDQTQTQPEATQTIAQPQVTVQEPDLITKVSQFKKPANPQTQNNGETFFDYKEIEKIQDPVARKFAEDAYKSMQAGFTKKTQEISEQRKSLEQKMEEMKNWSPERIQRELLNNPQFLEAAQQVAAIQNPPNSGLTDAEFSTLTPQEKAEIASLKSELNQLKQSNTQANLQAVISQKDAQLQSRFADYNPVEINAATERLANMNLADIREAVYKAQLHDDHVKAAYEMGKQDGRGLTQTKINGISNDGVTSINNDSTPAKNKGETDQAFFLRLAQRNLELSRRK